MFEVSLFTAFIAGSLSLLPSCGPLLLPAFFAHAFSTRSHLLRGTILFGLGFAAVFIPFGLGVRWLVGLLGFNREALYFYLGIIFTLWGLLSLVGFSFKPFQFRKLESTKNLYLRSGLLGLLFGVTSGACSAPVLGAITTLAVSEERFFQAGLLLFSFAVGLFVPLILLATVIQKFGFARLAWFYQSGLTFQISSSREIRIFWSNLFSAVIFIFLGITFLSNHSFWFWILNEQALTVWFYKANLWLMSR